MGDEGRADPRRARRHVDTGHSKAAHVLDESYPVDRLCMIAWMEHCRANGHEDVAAAIEDAQRMTVRDRWPQLNSPLPRVPRDFTKRAFGGA